MKHDDRNIDDAQQRVRRYWYDDGITEIAVGFLFLMVGLLFLVEAVAPPGSLPPNFSAIGLPILIIVGVWLAGRVVERIKERITYPRTGYVAYYRPSPSHRVVTVVVALLTGALATFLLRQWPSYDEWMAAVQGIAIGAFLLYLARTLGPVRFFLLALASAAIGVATSLASVGEELSSAIFYAAMGISFIVSGGATLRAYLDQTTPAEEV